MAEFRFWQAPVSPKALRNEKAKPRSQTKSGHIVDQIARAIDPDAWDATPGLSRQDLQKRLIEALNRVAELEGKPASAVDPMEWDDAAIQRRRNAALSKAKALYEECKTFIRTQEIRRSFAANRKK